MTDKELLELAAKAAEIELVGLLDKMIVQPDHRKGGFIIRNDRGGDSCWNPLTDDGDALRLAVKLGLNIMQMPDCEEPWVDVCGPESDADEIYGADPYVATRRAIVRAAAAIGKGMK